MTETNNSQSAIAAAMAELTRIERDSENKHAGYRYASADAVFDSLRPLLAKHGLIIHCSETAFQVEERNGKFWATARYELKLGDSAPEARTVYGWLTGPQTAGALATYAVKYWLRTKLLLNTGEPDADAEPKRAPRADARPKPGEKPKPATELQLARIRWYANSSRLKERTRNHLLARLEVNSIAAAAAGKMIADLEKNIGVLVHSRQREDLMQLHGKAEKAGAAGLAERLAAALKDPDLMADAAQALGIEAREELTAPSLREEKAE